VLTDVLTRLGQLQQERESHDPQEFCRRFWAVLKPLYVANPADAGKITWDRCDLPNEVNFMKPWLEHVLPSIQKTRLTAETMSPATMPVLIVHGTRDRSAPYGGARDWARMLPNARLLTVENVAHAPWIESPEAVFSALETFLDGGWPEAAERVTALDPGDEPAKAF
jgi:pimeloyl-ACP methyl ester carboxylesterase